MGWYGKLIGTALGAIIGRGLLGAIVGFVIGHLFDQRARAARASRAMPSRDLQSAFFRATFQVMGHAAKADGRVTEQEIDAARATMRRFSLGEADVRRAIDLFTEGKDRDFPLEDVLSEFRSASAGREDLRRLFVQIQLEAALQAGELSPPARAVFARMCSALGISAMEFAALEAMLRMHRGQPGGGGTARPAAARSARGRPGNLHRKGASSLRGCRRALRRARTYTTAARRRPIAVFRPGAQVAFVVLICISVWVLARRRETFEEGAFR